MSVVELRTPRLVLRGWRPSDKAPFAALNADPRVMEHFPSTLTADQSDEMVDRLQGLLERHGFGLWAVERLDTQQFIGFVGLSEPRFEERFTPCIEVGWRLAAEHWGQGFAVEGARAVLDHGFAHLALPRDEIVSFTTTTNTNSQRVMQKLGLHHDPADDFDHPFVADGPLRRHVLYRISRGEWVRR